LHLRFNLSNTITVKINYLELYFDVSSEISRVVTQKYSTSFYWASQFFDQETKKAIFNIYGFVRFADEIVDSFHDFNKEQLLNDFIKEYRTCKQSRISLNPIIYSFVSTCQKYKIEDFLVDPFLDSMRFDLTKKEYCSDEEINLYIHGSAEVIGLMCLKVFCKGDQNEYERLKPQALKLGAAFQKVNFLRDLKNDVLELKRFYFPVLVTDGFNEKTKKIIIADIEQDFQEAYRGIKQLPKGSKLAVSIAFQYYHELLKKIKTVKAEDVMQQRIRIPNHKKIRLILKAYILNIFT
jgi:15-cis-phytoene synthase